MLRFLFERTAIRLYFSAVFIACGVFAIPAFGQTVTGKWIGIQRALDNGESVRVFLDLQQTGAEVIGTVTTIGHVYEVKGTITGGHFELFSSPKDARPRVAARCQPGAGPARRDVRPVPAAGTGLTPAPAYNLHHDH